MTAATDTTIKFHSELEQGSDEWKAARCGIVTASVVGRLLSVTPLGALGYDCPECASVAGDSCVSMAKRKEGTAPTPISTLHGGRTATAKDNADTAPLVVTATDGDDARNLTLALVAERITQHVEDGYISDAMWRGIEEEPLARNAYAAHYQRQVDEMGFITKEIGQGWKLGYSPDGLVDQDGLIEIKSRAQKKQLSTILGGRVPVENMAQLQCGLFITGREWIDYVSYSGGMPLWTKRVAPDLQWFDAITTAVTRFENTAASMMATYQAAVAGLPVMPRTEIIPEMVI